MQVIGGYPDVSAYERGPTDEVDLTLSVVRQKTEIEAARLMVRQHAEDERAKNWIDHVDAMLGPLPATGQGWADRGMKLLELSMIEGIGLNAKACAAYAEECNKRAAWMDRKFSQRVQVDVDVAVNVLTQRLQEGRERVIAVVPQLPVTPEKPT